ncbi:MAG: methyltransferase domain-containing protein [Candidatus Micrarchaeota archaeon]
MKEKLLDIIVCPTCKGNLNLKATKQINDDVEEGMLNCRKCKVGYNIINSVPRFVPDDDYVENFSMEWNTHKVTQLDSRTGRNESEETFKEVTGFNQKDLKGKLVLDVGCGSGRYLEIASKFGAEVVGIDLSFAVDAAQENLGKQKNMHIIQANVFSLPFKEDTFDIIYSIGVLHHTPDCKKAFMCLPNLLKKPGKISIWLYSKKLHFIATDVLRIVTTRMNKHHLYGLCKTVVPHIYAATRVPLVGYPFRAFISTHHHPEWRVLDTFDWYSPKYQSKHSNNEVIQWFNEAGLKNARALTKDTSVTGEK